MTGVVHLTSHVLADTLCGQEVPDGVAFLASNPYHGSTYYNGHWVASFTYVGAYNGLEVCSACSLLSLSLTE
jgi:hypothetical protein